MPLVASLLLAIAARALAGPIGGNFEISGAQCRFPDAAHSAVAGKYLVVWADYNETRIHGRLVSDSGGVEGLPFRISEAPYGGLFAAVASNEAAGEFLVTWDDFGRGGDVIHGQRVRAADGALLAPNFALGTVAGGIRSAVAWSPTSDVYLVAYFVPGAAAEIYAQRVAASGVVLAGNFNVSMDAQFSGYPAVAWGEEGDQFLVSWDNEDGNIHARRVDARTGALRGPVIVVTTGGAKDRSCIAYDTGGKRWLVQYNDGANAGYSYDQSGRFVSPQGTLVGLPVPLAHTPAFEGDTQFGGDVAFAPLAARYFSSFGTDTGMAGQESLASGAAAVPQATLGTGFYTSLSNAADGARSRFLTVWEGREDAYRIYGQLWAAALGAPADFRVEAGDASASLTWRSTDDPQLTGTVIRFKPEGYPQGPGDGELLVDAPSSPGATDGRAHTGLTNWTTYYYAAFSHDAGPNYSPAARAAVTPRPASITVHESTFAAGDDGWTLTGWRAGALAPGTIARDPAAGDIVAAGSGTTNNSDACTREGGLMTRSISTAGRRRILIEYDVMASLHAPPSQSGSGGCAVLEGGIEDRLAVYYSTAGTDGPWTAAQILSEGSDLPTPWTRKLIHLAGLPAVDDNPAFALRFHWQLNHERDRGRLDSVRALSGAVTGPSPAIALSPVRLERTLEVGERFTGDALDVSNTGEGVLEFSVREELPWLAVSPVAASSAGPPRRLSVAYDAAGLAVGEHEGEIEIVAVSAPEAPQIVPVVLHVVPRACLRETFSYYDGELTTMGGASWSGSATAQLLVSKGVLVVSGGGGAVSATRPAACGAPDGVYIVRLGVEKQAGTGDFFWNIAIDDDSSDTARGNLARWYGGSTIVRGRIGSDITGDMVLTGPGVRDELAVRIDTAANVSEFLFNGASGGTISHGTGPTNRLGAIRIERFDRAGTGGDSIRFDDLIVESVTLHPFHRGDPDASGAADLADAMAILGYLFRNGPAPACAESADANNDGQIDISDALAVLLHLFAGRPIPPPGPPGSPCGDDPDPMGSARDLGCGAYAPCF